MKLHKCLVSVALLLTCVPCARAYGQQDTWESWIKKGDDALARQQFADAEQAYRESVSLASKIKGNDIRIALSLIKLAELFSSQSRTAEAEAVADQAIKATDKAMTSAKSNGGSNPVIDDYYRIETQALILDKSAAIFLANRQFSKAEQLYKRLIQIRESDSRAPEHPRGNEDFTKFLGQALTGAKSKVADVYDELGRVYFVQGRFGEAADVYSKSLGILESEFGGNQPPVARGLSNLATAYAAQSLYDRAQPLFLRAIEILERSNALEKAEGATTLENYALLLRKTGRNDEAAVMIKRAKDIRARLDQPQR